jgi:hypothetical protein
VTEETIRGAHARFKEALREQPADPPTTTIADPLVVVGICHTYLPTCLPRPPARQGTYPRQSG